ncbi:MAG: right-handed parallel beta-helix repeat-containing protein [Candidatus Omnitrophica bacterium]|nr:right-handed parallel beta-helix repeat-containing protein [Candidatus Omnitrophota bacterium]
MRLTCTQFKRILSVFIICNYILTLNSQVFASQQLAPLNTDTQQGPVQSLEEIQEAISEPEGYATTATQDFLMEGPLSSASDESVADEDVSDEPRINEEVTVQWVWPKDPSKAIRIEKESEAVLWEKVEGASGYRVEVKDKDSGVLVSEFSTEDPVALISNDDLREGHSYSVVVRAEFGAETVSLDSLEITIVKDRFQEGISNSAFERSVPEIQNDLTEGFTQKPMILEWKRVPDTLFYEISVNGKFMYVHGSQTSLDVDEFVGEADSAIVFITAVSYNRRRTRSQGAIEIPVRIGFSQTENLDPSEYPVVHVTTLKPEGPGSILEALKARGPKRIVFDVGGVVDLSHSSEARPMRDIMIDSSQVIIDGGNAPEPGVIFYGGGITIDGVSHVTIKNITVLASNPLNQSAEGSESSDAIKILNSKENVVSDITIENNTLLWAQDETIEVFCTKSTEDCFESSFEDIVIKNNIIGESIAGDRGHAQGILIDKHAHRVVIEQNLFMDNKKRNPKITRDSDVLMLNNLIYNPQTATINITRGKDPFDEHENSEKPLFLAAIGNQVIPGPNTGNHAELVQLSDDLPEGTKIFLSGNDFQGRGSDWDPNVIEYVEIEFDSQKSRELRRDIYEVVASHDGSAVPDELMAEELPLEWMSDYLKNKNIVPGDQLEETLLNLVGANPDRRQPIVERLIERLSSRTGEVLSAALDEDVTEIRALLDTEETTVEVLTHYARKARDFELRVLVNGSEQVISIDELEALNGFDKDHLPDGDHELNFRVKNFYGEYETHSFVLTLDTVRPVVSQIRSLETNDLESYELVFNLDGQEVRYSAQELRQFRLPDGNFTEGSNRLYFQFYDEAGNFTPLELTLQVSRIDHEAPVVEVQRNYSTNNPSDFELVYQVDGEEKRLSGETLRALLVADGYFKQGDNYLHLVEDDVFGNKTEQIIRLTVDSIKPEIVVHGALVTNDLDNYHLDLVIDGELQTLDALQLEAYRNPQGVLAEGENKFIFQAVDDFGNETIYPFRLFVDTVPPSIEVKSALQSNKKDDYVLEIEVDGTRKLSYSAEELQQLRVPSGPLQEGDNTFPVTVSDDAGNETTQEITVFIDSIGPQIETLSPLVITSNPQDYQLEVLIDGKNKVFSYEQLKGMRVPGGDLTEGLNEIRLSREDDFGNRTVEIIPLLIDTIPPVLEVEEQIITTSPEDFELEVFVDGQRRLLSGETLAAMRQPAGPLQQGNNPYLIVVRDDVMHETTKEVNIFVDSIGPEIVVQEPLITSDPQNYVLEVLVDGQLKSFDRERLEAMRVPSGPLTEGENQIRISRQDEYGNKTVEVVMLEVDTTPPVLEVESGTISTTDPQDFTLTVLNDGREQVLSNADLVGMRVPSGALEQGENRFEIAVRDEVGNVSEVQAVTVFIDSIGPEIVVQEPLITNDPQNYVLEVLVDGQLKSFDRERLEAMRVPSGPLTEGENQIRISRQDEYGNRTVEVVMLEVDTTPPVLEVESGTISTTDPQDFTLTVLNDGREQVLSNADLVGMRVPSGALEQGENRFEIVVRDEAGNVSEAQEVTVFIDSIGPEIVVQEPLITNDPQNYVLEVLVDGRLKSFDRERLEAMRVPSGPLTEGENQIRISRQDEYGNRTVEVVMLEVDTTPPVLEVESGTISTTDPQDFTLTVLRDGREHVLSNEELMGMRVPSGALEQGENRFEIVVRDEAGNVSEAQEVTVFIDSIGPEIVVQEPLITNDPQNYVLEVLVDGRLKSFDRERLEAMRVPSGPLTEGENQIRISRQDEYGNRTVKIVTLVISSQD